MTFASSHHSIKDFRIPTPLHYPHYEKEINPMLGLTVSESVAHFIRTQPDIVVSYTPPKEKLTENDDELGSVALSDYIQLADPFLVLVGLPHTMQRALCDPLYTVHVYPGSLGRGYRSTGGEFCILECDDSAKECQQIAFYQINQKTKKPVLVQIVALEPVAEKMASSRR